MRKFYLLSVLFFFALSVQAQKLPFQGKLIKDGVPLSGVHDITVSIPSIGWSEGHTVQFTDGLYFIVLGSETPIPGNIFNGTDERQMDISVAGEQLSPVTLYKPLTGEMTELNLQGPGNGLLRAAFGTGSSINENAPSLSMNGNLSGTRVWLGVSPNVDGTVESGGMSMNSSSGNLSLFDSGSSLFASSAQGSAGAVSFNQFWLRQGSIYNIQLFNQNWGNKGHGGTILLRGPSNNLNFEIGNKHWENADLPWFKMAGTSNNNVIIMSGEKYDENDPAKERGQFTAFDNDDNKALINSREINLLKPDWSPYAGLNSHGDAGNFFLNGPNSENIYLGNKSWENADLPHFLMKGTENNVIAEMSANNDENQSGYFNLHAKSGSNLSLTADGILAKGQDERKLGIGPDGLTMWDASWERGVFLSSFSSGSPGVRGSLELFGADSPEAFKRTGILGTQNFGNGDFGILTLIGSHAQAGFFDKSNAERINLGLVGNDGETGRLSLRGANPHVALDDAAGQNRVYIQTAEGAGGSSGQLELKGPGSANFFIGSKTWEDSDIPWFNMHGKDGEVKLNITSAGGEGEERGVLTLAGSNNDWVTLTNDGAFGSGPFNLGTGAVVHGTLTINGDIEGSGTNNYNSDERLKKNIQPLNGNILEKIESLDGYSYFWKQEEYPEKNFSAGEQIGLLAQELEAQFPALVKTGSDGFKSVNYNGFTAVLLQAVKQLNQKVEMLEKENQLLKDELVSASASQKEMQELKSQIEMLARLVQVKMDASGDVQSAENVSTTGQK